MKITLLVENQTGHRGARTCLSEWGLSAYVEVNDIRILFDTGHTGIYKQNAEKLGVDLQKTDFVVLSHHHWDHAGGLRFHNFESPKKLITHPLVLDNFYQDYGIRLEDQFKTSVFNPKKAFEFTENIFFLGEIPHTATFEKGLYKGKPIPDDSAIAIKSKQGVIVITGCSHSGIANICDYAKKVTGQDLFAVIGGFHLFEDDQEAVNGTITYFEKEKPEYLYPMHCVDFPTLTRFRNVFGIEKASTGDIIEIDT